MVRQNIRIDKACLKDIDLSDAMDKNLFVVLASALTEAKIVNTQIPKAVLVHNSWKKTSHDWNLASTNSSFLMRVRRLLLCTILMLHAQNLQTEVSSWPGPEKDLPGHPQSVTGFRIVGS
jgi:hypothetical protein